MSITLGSRSLLKLKGVHPDLVRVAHRAAAMATAEEDFFILEGVRSREQMMVNYGQGRTPEQLKAKGIPAGYAVPGAPKVTWLKDPFNSNHRKMPSDGYGHAIDAMPWPLDWNNKPRLTSMAELMMAAAAHEGVRIRWGRDWNMNGRYEERGETDGPHFELV